MRLLLAGPRPQFTIHTEAELFTAAALLLGRLGQSFRPHRRPASFQNGRFECTVFSWQRRIVFGIFVCAAGPVTCCICCNAARRGGGKRERVSRTAVTLYALWDQTRRWDPGGAAGGMTTPKPDGRRLRVHPWHRQENFTHFFQQFGQGSRFRLSNDQGGSCEKFRTF